VPRGVDRPRALGARPCSKDGDCVITAAEPLLGDLRAALDQIHGRSAAHQIVTSQVFGAPVRRVTGYEAACLLAFALAALVTAFFLVGQSVARYVSATVADLQVLQVVGHDPAAGRSVGLGRAFS
jgi:hypothetical protein